jgi:hypothetical protein
MTILPFMPAPHLASNENYLRQAQTRHGLTYARRSRSVSVAALAVMALVEGYGLVLGVNLHLAVHLLFLSAWIDVGRSVIRYRKAQLGLSSIFDSEDM